MTTSKRLVVVLSHITVILLGLATIIVANIGGPRGWKRWSFLIPPAAFMRSMGLIVNRGGNTINPGAVGSCPAIAMRDASQRLTSVRDWCDIAGSELAYAIGYMVLVATLIMLLGMCVVICNRR